MNSSILLRLLHKAGVHDPANLAWFNAARRLRRRVAGTDAGIRDAYLSSADPPRLQIGGGWRLLDGWLNTDLAIVPGVVCMDATKTFPFEAETFAYVFSEHMIEHIAYEQSLAMLKECYRVMRRDGVIRVVTPDFRAVAALYTTTPTPVQRAYLEFFRRHFVPKGQPSTIGAIANAFVRSWGHQHIYDEETLAHILREAGFVSVTRRPLGTSDHTMLRGLENEKRYPPGLLDYESVALEAAKR